MRLWHESLITALPRQQLLGQHRECAALRGKGWGKPHATVNYVFTHSPYKLFQYHQLILAEMVARGYQPDLLWFNPLYRGKAMPANSNLSVVPLTTPIYSEHDGLYLSECLDNLNNKGVFLATQKK